MPSGSVRGPCEESQPLISHAPSVRPMKIPASDHSDNASSHKEAPVAFATGSVIEDVAGCSILLRGSTPAQTLALQRLLATGGFRQVATVNGHVEAEQFLSRMKVDLLILSGFSTADGSFLKALRNSEVGLQIPVVAVATWDESLMELGLTSGVSDFVREPIVRHELFARVRNLLTLRRCRERLEHYTEDLERQVRRRTAELTASRAEIVRCLARAAEFRDDDTGLHVARVGRYAGLIARKLGFPENYVDASVTDSRLLLDALGQLDDPLRHVEVIWLDAEQDGIDQIATTLASREGVDLRTAR